MDISKICDNYFSGFREIAHIKENSAGTNVLATLKILSYATVVIPLAFALLQGAASLANRGTKKEADAQDRQVTEIAVKEGIIPPAKTKSAHEELAEIYRKDIADHYTVHDAGGGGNCLFHSLFYHLKNHLPEFKDLSHDQGHLAVRKVVTETMKKHGDTFKYFVDSKKNPAPGQSLEDFQDEIFNAYVSDMEKPNVWGGDRELNAMLMYLEESGHKNIQLVAHDLKNSNTVLYPENAPDDAIKLHFKRSGAHWQPLEVRRPNVDEKPLEEAPVKALEETEHIPEPEPESGLSAEALESVAAELASLIAKRHSYFALRSLAQDFYALNVTSEDERIKIAAIMAKNNPIDLIHAFHCFDITNQDARIMLAKTLAETQGNLLASHFGSFNIAKEDDRFEIAKIIVKKSALEEAEKKAQIATEPKAHKRPRVYQPSNARKLLWNLENFKIVNEDSRIELARMIAENELSVVAHSFDKFGISKEAVKIELANLVAQNNPDSLLLGDTLSKFQISDEDERVKIAEIIAKKRPEALAKVFRTFNIQDDAGNFAIAKHLIGNAPNALLDDFWQFRIKDNNLRLELLETLCNIDPLLALKRASVFDVDSDPRTQVLLSKTAKAVLPTLPFQPIEEFELELIKEYSPNFPIRLDDDLCLSLFKRVAERDPYGLQEMIVNGKYDANFLAFVNAFPQISKDQATQLLDYNYKMNQALPMTPEVVELLAKYPDGDSYIQLTLMMQTHPDISEIKEAMETQAIPYDKKSFFTLDQDVQNKLLCRAQVLRDRQALPIANRILKEASQGNPVDDRLLEMAIKFFIKTTVAGSGETAARLQHFIERGDISEKNKVLAIQALGAVEMNPENTVTKTFLEKQLSSESKAVQNASLNALAFYNFTEEEAPPLIEKLKLLAQDPSFKKPAAYLATLLPSEEALLIAHEIVNDGTWDKPNPDEFVAKKGEYLLFSYRPSHHDSQSNMNSIIRQRLIAFHRNAVANEAANILQDYKQNKDNYPDLKQLEANIRGFENNIRYYPTPLFLPEGTVCFRGINARKGDVLADAAFQDFFVQGAGASNLSLFDRYDTGTWSKTGQMFSSTSLDYVMNGYFDENGLLMAIPGESLNESILRRNIRLEKERSIHYVSYSKFTHQQISQIFLATHQKPRVESYASAPFKAVTSVPKAPTLEKIARRNLERVTTSAPRSLKDRVTYFDPQADLKTEMKDLMKTSGLKEATEEEIIDENLLRRIIESRLLKDRLTNSQLKEALSNVPDINPLRVVQTS